MSIVVSDAGRYMVNGVINSDENIPDSLHVTCSAHLVHNCAVKIKAHFKYTDFLISSIEAITHKNKTNSVKFDHIGLPSTFIVARSSRLRVVKYYSDIYQKEKKLFRVSKAIVYRKLKLKMPLMMLIYFRV